MDKFLRQTDQFLTIQNFCHDYAQSIRDLSMDLKRLNPSEKVDSVTLFESIQLPKDDFEVS